MTSLESLSVAGWTAGSAGEFAPWLPEDLGVAAAHARAPATRATSGSALRFRVACAHEQPRAPTLTAPPSSAPELSVVVLCYRAEEGAPEFAAQLCGELDAAQLDYELILVANHHPARPDRTPELVRAFAESRPRVRAITRVKEGMMGWDMRSGLEEARGAHLAVIDGDGQMPTSDIVKVYRLLQVGGYDLVKTFRAERFDGAYRATISRCYNVLFRLLFPGAAKFRDINSKPKVMTRAAYEAMDLVSNDWFTDAEIMIEAIRNRLAVGEVSTIFLRNERRATLVPPSAIWEFLRNLLYYRFRGKRRKP